MGTYSAIYSDELVSRLLRYISDGMRWDMLEFLQMRH